MNRHEAVLYLMAAVHIGVWVLAVFGGLYSCRVAAFNMLALLPLIYVVQSFLTTHIFVKAKIDFILRHPGAFKADMAHVFSEGERRDIAHHAAEAGYSVEAVTYARRVMRHYEDALVAPRVTRAISKATKRSYQNPMSAQGMLVLAYIVNAAIYAARCRGRCG